MFEPVLSKVDFPELEERILLFWKDADIFRRSVEQRPADNTFVFYEGPPTANGRPGVHHVLARVFKDVVTRYRAMRGFRVPRKGGWDTHGLPVELEVERELKLTSKSEIERFGIEEFNRRCRESVFRYVRDWEQMTERIGFWVDMDDPYVTYSNEYIESCWWVLRSLWDKGLVYEDYRVTPHCPRCDTSLSDHEVAQGYQEDTEDPSVYIKFRVLDGPNAPADLRLADGVPTYLLAWTTTPWTLPGNVALALAPDAEYAVVEREGNGGETERLVLAEPLVEAAVAGEKRIVGRVRGRDLVGLTYEPLFRPETWGTEPRAFRDGRLVALRADDPVLGIRTALGAEFVSLADGTGIVHIAPAFGSEDFDLGREYGLLFLQPIDSRGVFQAGSPLAGMFAKDADNHILADLRGRDLLLRAATIRHTYPFCWRCGTPLLYYAKPSWYIRTTAARDRLIAGNEEINWYPEHIKHGRFGNWLENNVDWAVSRERYWGTPLPFWRCVDCGEVTCIGSATELRERAVDHDAALSLHDFHRPCVDEIAVRCVRCGAEARRIPEVADAWFDSGAMPYAQNHHPFEGAETFGQRFPADFICEAIDQTRGWFYTLHAEATLLAHAGAVPGGIAYRNVICLGHVLDAKGEKMSKSRDNVVEPMPVLAKHGADALRWYLYTASPAGSPRRFSSDLVGEALRRFILTLWNTYSFFVTYAEIDGFDPRSRPPGDAGLAELDRWALSELATLVERVTRSMEAYDPTDAGRAIQEFVEDLSNWYVRRSRRRFWKSEDDADKRAAYHTLYSCLVTVSKLLAPFAPFVSEAIYRNLAAGTDPEAPESVHLADWPVADETRIDERLARETRLVMRLASLGRAARSRAAVKVRQPLGRAVFGLRAASEIEGARGLADQLAEELNVKEVAFLGEPGIGSESDYLSYVIKPNLPLLGPKYGGDLGAVRAALAAADPQSVALAVRAGREVALDGYRLAPEEVLVEAAEREGYVAAQDAGYTAIIATSVTPELASEGLAREIVHRVQGMRRDAGFEIADRIELTYEAPDEIAAVLDGWGEYVRQETLAERMARGRAAHGAHAERHEIGGFTVRLAVRRV